MARDLACRVEPMILERSKKVESDNRLVRAAEELLAEQKTTRSVAFDEKQIVLRYWQNVARDQIDDAVQRIAEAWRTLAPYR